MLSFTANLHSCENVSFAVALNPVAAKRRYELDSADSDKLWFQKGGSHFTQLRVDFLGGIVLERWNWLQLSIKGSTFSDFVLTPGVETGSCFSFFLELTHSHSRPTEV